MRLLANENFPRDAVEALRNDGHDVSWVRTECPGISDREVLAKAQDDNRIVVTLDKDFGELALSIRLISVQRSDPVPCCPAISWIHCSLGDKSIKDALGLDGTFLSGARTSDSHGASSFTWRWGTSSLAILSD